MRYQFEDEAVLEIIREDQELLAEFGLELSGCDPGIQARLPSMVSDEYHTLTFAAWEWHWLRPLLKELKARRREMSRNAKAE